MLQSHCGSIQISVASQAANSLFAYENLQKPAIPNSFAAPPSSTLRGSSEKLWAWYDRQEHRSLRGSVREVLGFYEAP